MSSNYYPSTENDNSLYYVEFERGDRKNEFTLFKRQWFHIETVLIGLDGTPIIDMEKSRMTDEAHPWNIFTATYGPEGTMPDRKWVEWMVDALNKQTVTTDIPADNIPEIVAKWENRKPIKT